MSDKFSQQLEDFAKDVGVDVKDLKVIWPDLAQVNPWVSVDDRLPEHGQLCLILIDVGGNIERGKYRGDCNWLGNWFSMRGNDHAYKVTHWMPLPEPPKQ